MKKLLAFLMAMLMLLSLAACGSTSSEADSDSTENAADSTEETTESVDDDAEAKTTLTIGVDAEFTSLNPVTTGTEGSLLFRNGVYETLFVFNDDGEPEPWLAESYEWTDDTTLVIKLHEGVYFHNGNEFTAEDVLYSLGVVAATPSAASRVGSIDLEASYAGDDYTVVLKTTAYSAVLISNLAGELCCMMDKDFGEENEGNLDQVSNGTGPYMLKEWNMGTDCVIVKNDNYWNSDTLDAYFQEIDIKFFNENSTAWMEYESGTLDVVYVSNSEAIEALASDSVDNTYYVTEQTNYVTSIFMSQNVDEQFTDINLRKAIAHAIDVETMVSSICGNSVLLASSMFPSSMAGYIELGNYEYDVELAQSYLDQYMADHNVSSVDLTMYVTTTGYNQTIAESIQAYLADIGISVTIETGAVSDIIPLMMSGTVNFGMSNCGGGYDPDEMFVAMRNSTANLLTKFADESILTLIDEATSESDYETRLDIYAQIQQFVYDEYYFIPLYENLNYYAANESVTGIVFGTGHGLMPAYFGWDA